MQFFIVNSCCQHLYTLKIGYFTADKIAASLKAASALQLAVQLFTNVVKMAEPKIKKPKAPRRSRARKGESRGADTRQAIMQATLELLARDKSFDGLSLREVTREVGVVPTAFYRHFHDMEELGMVLVEDCLTSMRELLRAARGAAAQEDQIARRSIETFVTYVRANRRQFQFIVRERFGGVAALRNAIHDEIQAIIAELAIDLTRFPVIQDWSEPDQLMLADLIVNAVANTTNPLLRAHHSGREDGEIIALAEKQLTLLILGASLWKSAGTESK